MKSKYFRLNLRLFDGAAAGGSAVGGGDGGTGELASSDKSGKVEVVYGKQDTAEDGTAESQIATDNQDPGKQTKDDDPADQKPSFDELIKGEYKADYDSRMKAAIERRFKDQKALAEFRDQANPVLDMLYGKYGVKPGDVQALEKAIQSDASFYEEAASQAGLTVEQYKAIKTLERENQALKDAQLRAEASLQTEKIYGEWLSQAEELKKIYPTFDFATEVANPQFAKLLENGVDVHAAFKAIHADEILQEGMLQTAHAVRKNVTDNIRARGARPAENGMSSQAAVVVKNDVSKLDSKDRAEIARRVQRGEVISF